MSERELTVTTASLLLGDPLRAACLDAVQALDLNDAWIAAGFVRNAIWDHCHGYKTATPLNDVDVVYFDPSSISDKRDAKLTEVLSKRVPGVNWEVKNQARMHRKHHHAPYNSTEEAIGHWVEVQTCIAAAMDSAKGIRLLAPFGLQHNFSLHIDINPLYPRPDIFQRRISEKQWLAKWPRLCVKTGMQQQ